MSNSLALAAATAAFGRVIAQALHAVPNLSAAPELRIGRPPHEANFVGANLFLYRVSPSAARRNEDLVTRASDGTLVRRPQAALDLDYLISFYGSETGLEPQRLMGSVVALLHAVPLLTPSAIHAAIASSGPLGILAGSDLDQQLEPVRFSLIPLDTESLHRIWSLFHHLPYSLSVAYTASTLLLDADMVPSRALPARQAVVGAMPMLPASIVSLSPPVVTFGAGATLMATGKGLDSAGARLQLGSITAKTVARDGGLVAEIPPALRAGVQSVRVVTGDATAAAGTVESADAVFVLAPRVADGAVYGSFSDPRTNEQIQTITVNLAPTPAFTQSVQLYLNPLRLPGAPPSAPDAVPAGSVSPLRFQMGAASAAEFDRGHVTPELRDAFAANRMTVPETARIAAESDGVWRLADAQHFNCRLERDGGNITVHFGLAVGYANGTLAFRVRNIRPARYVVSVQIGDRTAATSEMRWGVPLFHLAGPATGLDQGNVPAAMVSAFAASGVTLSSNLAVARPIPGDGWQISDVDQQRRYWIAAEGDAIAAYQLDAAGGIFFGPLVTIPQ